MNWRDRLLLPARIAGLALVISAAVTAWYAIRVARPAHVADSGRTDVPPTVPEPARRGGAADDEARQLAVSNDPFMPDRHPAAERFRMPGEAAPMAPVTVAAAPLAAIRLIGTVVAAGGGGFVVCQMGNDPPRTIRAGDRIGTLQLRTVGQGRAVFVSADGSPVEVRAPKVGS